MYGNERQNDKPQAVINELSKCFVAATTKQIHGRRRWFRWSSPRRIRSSSILVFSTLRGGPPHFDTSRLFARHMRQRTRTRPMTISIGTFQLETKIGLPVELQLGRQAQLGLW